MRFMTVQGSKRGGEEMVGREMILGEMVEEIVGGGWEDF